MHKIGKNEICFNTIFQHGSGQLLGIELHPIPNHIAATAHPLDINKLHTMFGHPNSQVLAATVHVSNYGFKPRTHWSIHVLIVLSVKPNRRILLN
jgi:hypothetical protein